MDNMMINIAQGVYLSDAEFQQEIARRRDKLHLSEGQTVPGCPLCGSSKLPFANANAGQQ